MSHIEIASNDPEATRKFLEKAFGWTFHVLPEMGYSMYGRNEGAEDASVGIRARTGPESPGSIGYVFVPGIDDAIRSGQAAGAKIIREKTAVPGRGWVAVSIAPGDIAQGLFQTKH
ncbi:MAG: hypothetical protein WBF81_03720 [Thermoplasmata archaeon]